MENTEFDDEQDEEVTYQVTPKGIIYLGLRDMDIAERVNNELLAYMKKHSSPEKTAAIVLEDGRLTFAFVYKNGMEADDSILDTDIIIH